MLQRIQSLHLLIAALFMCVTLFIPVAEYINVEDEHFKVNLDYWTYMPIMALGIAIFNVIIIFLFKNRRLQIALAVISMILKVVFFALIVFQVEYFSETFGGDQDASIVWGTFLPFIAVAFDLFAIRGISKDQRLVRSMDRLR